MNDAQPKAYIPIGRLFRRRSKRKRMWAPHVIHLGKKK